MKILVTGADGQLGTELMAEIARRGDTAIGLTIGDCDITDREAVERSILGAKPDAVIHTAAWTAVDLAETNEDKCRAVNANGTENVALFAQTLDIPMVYLSTDYVFDGMTGEEPRRPDDPDKAPINVYGRTKYEGEVAVERLLKKYYIVRIAWAFGPHGKNFVGTMLNLAETHDTLRVVSDQIGTPTYMPDLAKLLCDMVKTDRYGVYHATNEGGFLSWYDFAVEIFRQAGKTVKVIPVSSEEYAAPAKRPYNSRLDKSKLVANGFTPLPDWRDALGRYLKEIKK